MLNVKSLNLLKKRYRVKNMFSFFEDKFIHFPFYYKKLFGYTKIKIILIMYN